jgi:hypothetical protein
MNKEIKSCWICKYQNIFKPTFLGYCTWFSKNKKGEDKEIPPKVVDVGCNHWEERQVK